MVRGQPNRSRGLLCVGTNFGVGYTVSRCGEGAFPGRNRELPYWGQPGHGGQMGEIGKQVRLLKGLGRVESAPGWRFGLYAQANLPTDPPYAVFNALVGNLPSGRGIRLPHQRDTP